MKQFPWVVVSMSQQNKRSLCLLLVLVAAGLVFTATCCPASDQPSGPTPTCEPTKSDALGPFYEPNAPERSAVGKGYVLTGVVRSSADCSPLEQARIEFWLAGPKGQYDDDHRATVFPNKSGAYRFESNFPPPYYGRPPHIHIQVSAKGYRTLVTQHYPVKGGTQGTFDIVLVPAP